MEPRWTTTSRNFQYRLPVCAVWCLPFLWHWWFIFGLWPLSFFFSLLQSCCLTCCSSLHTHAAYCSCITNELNCFCVRPVLQFVQFYCPNPSLQHACSPSHPWLYGDLKSRRYSSSKLLMKVMNSARPDQTPGELRTEEVSLSFYFDSKLSVTTEPYFQSVWYSLFIWVYFSFLLT